MGDRYQLYVCLCIFFFKTPFYSVGTLLVSLYIYFFFFLEYLLLLFIDKINE